MVPAEEVEAVATAFDDHEDDEHAPRALPNLDGFRELRGSERAVAFLSVEREVRRLQALQAAMITEVRTSQSFHDDGHRDARAWIKAAINSAASTARGIDQKAAMLADMPLVAEQHRQGNVGDDQIRMLTRLHQNERARPLLVASDKLFEWMARDLRIDDFALACNRWLGYADPNGRHRSHEEAVEKRRVRIIRSGARGEIYIDTDALTLEILEDIINAHADGEFLTDVETNKQLHGDEADQHPLPRTNAQRRHDAVVAMALKSMTTLDPARLQLIVNMLTTPAELDEIIRDAYGSEEAEGGAAGEWDEREDEDDDDNDRDDSRRERRPFVGAGVLPPNMRLSETSDGTPVDPDDLLAAALCGNVRRVVLDDTGRVIDLGRRSRLFRGAAREAVLLMGNRCAWPGCGLHMSGIQIDHNDEWQRNNGATNPANGGPLCPRHNRFKHDHKVRVRRDATGWHFYRPDGTEITPLPGGRGTGGGSSGPAPP